MFTAIKAPLSLAAVLIMSAACSSGVSSQRSVSTQNPAPRVDIPAPAATSSTFVGTQGIAPSYQAAPSTFQAAPVYGAQPSLTATQAPLMLDAPSFSQPASAFGQQSLQPASAVTFDSSVNDQIIPLQAPSYNAPTLSAPSYGAPSMTAPTYTAPSLSVPSLPEFAPQAIPVTDADSILPPIVPSSYRTVEATSGDVAGSLPVIAMGSPLLEGTVYGTSFEAHSLLVK